MSLESISIFTDGAARGNPGPGGFGAIIIAPKNRESGIKNDEVVELGGYEEHTTNNRMELQAAISALSFIKKLKAKSYKLIAYSDSSYLINGITKWVHVWQKNGWKTAGKKEVENRDLWEQLLTSTIARTIEWKYVGGHVGVAGNIRCDEIATLFADGEKAALYSGSLAQYPIKNILDVSENREAKSEKRKAKQRQSQKAYSYVSAVGGVIQTHKTWAECAARVKGVRGARYQKVFSPEEEAALITAWSLV